jgi:hypothetical protein
MSYLLIRGKNLQGANDILSATRRLSAAILSVEHNAIYDFRIVAPHDSTINWIDLLGSERNLRKGTE